MSQAPIRTAILGLGRIGWPAHFERLAADPRFLVVAAADGREEVRTRASERTGCRTFPDPEPLLGLARELEVELVVNALPSSRHVDLGLSALEHGCHTVIEKPVAATREECRRLAAAASAAGRLVFPHHNYRFRPSTRYLEDLLAGGSLGRIHHCSINILHGFLQRDDWQTLRSMNGGLAVNHGTHYLDLALHLLGWEVADLWSDSKLVLSAGDAEDHCCIVLRLASGAVISLTLSTAWAGASKPAALCLTGTRGAVQTDFDQAVVTWCEPHAVRRIAVDPGHHASYRGAKLDLTERREAANSQRGGDFYDAVFDTLRRDAPPAITLSQATTVIGLIEQVHGRAVDDLRPAEPKAMLAAAG